MHFFLLQVTAKGTELVTQLYFRTLVPPSYEDYVRNRDTQFPQVDNPATNNGPRNIQFDLAMQV